MLDVLKKKQINKVETAEVKEVKTDLALGNLPVFDVNKGGSMS